MALFAAALIFIGLSILLGLLARSRYPEHKELISLCAWSILVAVLALGSGAWQMLLDPEDKADVNRGRILVLLVGGVFGFLLFLLGVALVIHWWDIFLTWTEVGKGEKPLLVMLALATLVVGLGVMFLSLQVARTQERSDPTRASFALTATTRFDRLAVTGDPDGGQYLRVSEVPDEPRFHRKKASIHSIRARRTSSRASRKADEVYVMFVRAAPS